MIKTDYAEVGRDCEVRVFDQRRPARIIAKAPMTRRTMRCGLDVESSAHSARVRYIERSERGGTPLRRDALRSNYGHEERLDKHSPLKRPPTRSQKGLVEVRQNGTTG